MKYRALVGAVAALSSAAFAQPIDPTFTYQGELADGGIPATGMYDLRFRLYDSSSGTTQVGPTLCADNITVTNGRFTVALDFGAGAFNGQKRFLEMDVRTDAGATCADPTGYTTLAPRQDLTATPHASFASSAASATTATTATNALSANTALTATSASTASNALLLNGEAGSFYTNAANLTGTLSDARLSGNIPRLNAPNTFTGAVAAPTFTGSGAALTNLNASNASSGTLPDGRLSANVPLLNIPNTFTGAITAPSFSGSGAGLTNLNAANLATGTLPGARLSGTYSNSVAFTNAANAFTGTFAGPGGGLTGLNAASIASGTLADARLSANVPLQNTSNTFSAANTFTGGVAVGAASTEAPFHVTEGSAGLVTASASASGVFERSGANYVQLLSPDASERGLIFGSPANAAMAGIFYTNGGAMSLRTGGNATRMVVTDAGLVGIGTAAPEAALHVRSTDSLGTIIVTPGVADTQSQLLLAENTSASNAMMARYNGATNNLEVRGLAANVESGPHMTINRDSGNVVVNGAAAALTVNASTTGDGTVALPNASVSAVEMFNEPGVDSSRDVNVTELAEDVTTTVETVIITAPAAGHAVLIGTVVVENCDALNSTVYVVASESSTISALAGQPTRVITGCAPATITTHTVVSVNAGSNTFYLRVMSFNANVHVVDRRLTAMYFPTEY